MDNLDMLHNFLGTTLFHEFMYEYKIHGIEGDVESSLSRDMIARAFKWSDSFRGHEFWSRKNSEWGDYLIDNVLGDRKKTVDNLEIDESTLNDSLKMLRGFIGQEKFEYILLMNKERGCGDIKNIICRKNLISDSFSWYVSKFGFDYWKNINDQWIDFLEDVEIGEKKYSKKQNEKEDVFEAMNIIQKKLKEDSEYYNTWKSNIVMFFQDKLEMYGYAFPDSQEMFGKAADNFLNVFVMGDNDERDELE